MNWPQGPPPSWLLWPDSSDCDPDGDLPREEQDFPNLMNSSQAAAFIGRSKPWVNELARNNRLPVVRMGRSNYFRKGDLAIYLAETGGTR